MTEVLNCTAIGVTPRNDTWPTCNVDAMSDLLNTAFICDRGIIHVVIFTILYLFVAILAIVSNASVVLASIMERWKEIDQFTFVFAVSLSFNHFLVAFLVYPMGCYTMLRTDGWGIGSLWCTFTAYCSSYFDVLYMMHVLMIAFDMILYTTTKLKVVVKVFLVKKVAMSLWVTTLIPYVILLWNDNWFLKDGGTLGVKHKYSKCVILRGELAQKDVINCYVTYTFVSHAELNIYVICFILLPFAYVAVLYVTQLYLRKRSLGSKELLELCNDDENAATFIQRYKASVCMISVFGITQLPKWITSIVLLATEDPADTVLSGPDHNISSSIIAGMDFLSYWTCLGSILIPVCYMMTCPTYFHAVTETRMLGWLRNYADTIHGKTYIIRYAPNAACQSTPHDILAAEASLIIDHTTLEEDQKSNSLVISNNNTQNGMPKDAIKMVELPRDPNHVKEKPIKIDSGGASNVHSVNVDLNTSSNRPSDAKSKDDNSPSHDHDDDNSNDAKSVDSISFDVNSTNSNDHDESERPRALSLSPPGLERPNKLPEPPISKYHIPSPKPPRKTGESSVMSDEEQPVVKVKRSLPMPKSQSTTPNADKSNVRDV